METVSNKQEKLHRDADAFYLHGAMRKNLVLAMEIKKNDRVLLLAEREIAVEEALRERAGGLTVADAKALMQADQTCETYDVIICLGQKPKAGLLTFCSKLLSREGRVYLAFDNYLQNTDSICEQEQFSRDAGKCSLPGAKRELAKAGLLCHQVWYPYPDWRFMYSVFSDAFLPNAKEFSSCHNRLDHRKPEQTKMWEQAIADDMFFYLAPAFLICGVKPGQSDYGDKEEKENDRLAEKTVYWRFSNDRKKQLAIYTRIGERSGQRFVEKGAIFPEGQAHIDQMYDLFEALDNEYAHPLDMAEIICRINKCEKSDNILRFEYVDGRPLEDIVLELLENGQQEEARRWVKAIAALVRGDGAREFEITDRFTELFGDVGEEVKRMGLTCGGVTNIDPLLSNFLLQEHVLTMIDYEWSFTFPVPVDFAVFRMIFYLLHNHADIDALQQTDWYDMLGISRAKQALFLRMEQSFQTYLVGGKPSERSQYEWFLSERQKNLTRMPEKTQIAYYWDDGTGFSPQNVRQINGNSKEGIEVVFVEGCRRVRLDLNEEPCLICLKEPLPLEEIDTNGFWLSDTQILFTESDPQITGMAREQDKGICIVFDRYEVPLQLSEQLTCALQKGKDDDRQCAYLSEKVAQMEASMSWKVTKPLRKLKGN